MTKNQDTTYITVGRIGSTYGVRGWVRVQISPEFAASLFELTSWYISGKDRTWDPVKIENIKYHSKEIIAKFVGIDTPEDARLLAGKLIAITRAKLPPLKENEYYWSDLIGLNVVNKDGTPYGTVSYIMATGANDVLIVKNEKEHAIPYLYGTVVLNVDLEKRIILVDWELI